MGECPRLAAGLARRVLPRIRETSEVFKPSEDVAGSLPLTRNQRPPSCRSTARSPLGQFPDVPGGENAKPGPFAGPLQLLVYH